MENEILVLKKSHVKGFAELIDEAYDFKKMNNKVVGAAIEAFDGKGAEIALNFGNKRISALIPDEYKDELHTAFDDVLDGDNDYTEAIENAIEIVDQLKDKLEVKPWVKATIDSLLELVKVALLFLQEKKAN